VIRVVIFDLGRTLIDSTNQPFAHVKEALTAISSFTTTGGTPLRSCLVSDFRAPSPPVTAAKIKAIFDEYLAILDQTGLRPFFEPVKKRVTLSTHAGTEKPDRKIFQTALQRLGAKVPLTECLLVTEESAHIHEVRHNLGMQTLQFRSAGSSEFDFDDWAEVPMLIANLIAPHQFANMQAAVKERLAATHGVSVVSVEPSSKPEAMKIAARAWHPISVSGFDDLRDVHVEIPVEGEVTLGAKGTVKSVALGKPSAEHIAEAVSFVRSLAIHGQIGGRADQRARGVTHQIETDEKGSRRLVRKRFSAV